MARPVDADSVLEATAMTYDEFVKNPPPIQEIEPDPMLKAFAELANAVEYLEHRVEQLEKRVEQLEGADGKVPKGGSCRLRGCPNDHVPGCKLCEACAERGVIS